VRAYLPRVEGESETEGLQFGPGDFTDLLSVGGVQ
jgi:hypothetical protein